LGLGHADVLEHILKTVHCNHLKTSLMILHSVLFSLINFLWTFIWFSAYRQYGN